MAALKVVTAVMVLVHVRKTVLCTECISSPNSNVWTFILDNFDSTSCLTLKGKAEAEKPEIIPLHVNKSCVNGSHVDVMALFSGHQDCSNTRFLFASQKGSNCTYGHRFQTLNERHKEDNKTLCLLRCLKSETTADLQYDLELIHGIHSQGLELSGLQLHEDLCVNNSCGNNGECDNNIDSYSCVCQPDYTGTNCETEIDDCDGDPCQNNGTCADGINSYSCDCTEGFTGEMCETNINECDEASCHNGGTCQDAINSYTCFCTCGLGGMNCETEVWNEPLDWAGDTPVVYQGFEDSSTFVLHEAVIVPGKICNGVKTDKEHEQYVDIGNLYDACLAIRPSSCVNGGTVSIWVKIEDDGYVISSRVQSGEGFSVEARGSNEIRYRVVNETDRQKLTINGRSTEWLHIVLILPAPKEVILVYHEDVMQSGSANSGSVSPGTPSGSTVIGKRYTDGDEDYGTVTVDELVMWNRALSEDEVDQTYNMYF